MTLLKKITPLNMAMMAGLFLSVSPMGFAKNDAPSPQKSLDTVVAHVNGEKVTLKEVETLKKSFPEALLKQMQEKKFLFPFLRHQIIQAKILKQKALNSNVKDMPEVKNQLEKARESIISQMYIAREISNVVTEDKIQAAYNDYKKNYPQGQHEYRARHILVPDYQKAQSILDDLQKGEDFMKMAREHSKDRQTAPEGGDLGYFTKEMMVPAFFEAVQTLKPGKVHSSPVKTEFGYHIIRLEDKRKSKPKSYDVMKQQLKMKLSDKAIEKMIDGLEKDADVKVFDEMGNPDKPFDMKELAKKQQKNNSKK